MAAIGARIADQLVQLVQALGDVKRGLGTEAVQPVGMTLQFSEIVKQWRWRSANFGITRFDGGHSPLGAGNDASGFHAIGR